MATNQRKYQLIGKELAYLVSRLRTIDTTIMCASVLKLVEELESNHIDFFQSRRATWITGKCLTCTSSAIHTLGLY